jgi:hypothetical protein
MIPLLLYGSNGGRDAAGALYSIYPGINTAKCVTHGSLSQWSNRQTREIHNRINSIMRSTTPNSKQHQAILSRRENVTAMIDRHLLLLMLL